MSKRVSVEHARSYISALDLPKPRTTRGTPTDTVAIAFDSAKTQAAVVGSDVISFVTGVTPERREAILQSALLAQLAAKKKVSDPTRIYDWYDTYFEVLTMVG